MEKATFAAGCFWGVEYEFSQVKGVTSTAVGYMGGTKKNPTYQDVCTDTTGHAEVVELEYDPSIVSYMELLSLFWNIHDPTQRNRQGPDVGSQYRSVIFFYTEVQKEAAEKSKNELQNSRKYKNEIATQITSASTFYKAEEYHQKYFEKNSNVHCAVKGRK
jgi:peptide-methionine (S)-S-oxide reductase